MNKDNLKGFTDELEKQAIPISLMKGLSHWKAWRAGVKGKKAWIRQVDREIKQFRFKDPSFDAGSYRVKRMAELETKGREAVEKALEAGKTPGGGQSFLSRHKGKLLLGGAAAGGLYLANKMSENDTERRQREAALRQMRMRRYY